MSQTKALALRNHARLVHKIFGQAEVYDSSILEGNANVSGFAEVFEEAVVKGQVYQAARVFGNATVEETGIVKGNAVIHGHAVISQTIETGEEL